MNKNGHERTREDPVVSLRCYEPAGSSIDLSIEDICGHTLVLGGTGAGKTTRCVYPMLTQLIGHRESDSGAGHALIIFDTKGDGEMRSVVSDACEQSGRSSDLVIVDGSGTSFIDPLELLQEHGLESVQELASLLTAGIPRDPQNRYWDNMLEILVQQVLRLLVISGGDLNLNRFLEFALRYLLGHTLGDPFFKEIFESMEARSRDLAGLDHLLVEEILSAHRMWETLEYRTKGILRSMAALLVVPLNQPLARRYLSGNRACVLNEVLSSGRILFVSIDAMRYPEIARLVGVILKCQFYGAVLDRRAGGIALRPAGFIIDDWPLTAVGDVSARYSDVTALGMIRSRGGYMVAASQGLSALDLTIGPVCRKAAVANFSNLFFFRGRDAEVDAMAAAYLGEKRSLRIDTTKENRSFRTRNTEAILRTEREVRTPAVPIGTIAQLPTGDAFALVGSSVYSHAMSLIPTYSKRN